MQDFYSSYFSYLGHILSYIPLKDINNIQLSYKIIKIPFKTLKMPIQDCFSLSGS